MSDNNTVYLAPTLITDREPETPNRLGLPTGYNFHGMQAADFVPFGMHTGVRTPSGFPGFFSTPRSLRHTEIAGRYRQQQQKLPGALNQQVAKITGSSSPPTSMDAVDKELSASRALLAVGQAALKAANRKALEFDGTDPLDSPEADFQKMNREAYKTHPTAQDIKNYNVRFNVWQASYQAAFDAKLHAQGIDLLERRIKQLQATRQQIQQQLDAQAAADGIEVPHRPSTFTLAQASTALPLAFAASAEANALFESSKVALQSAIRQSAPVLLGGLERTFGVVSLMLHSVPLGNGERLGLSVPLTDLIPGSEQEQEVFLKTGGTLPLKVRISSGTLQDNSHIFMVPTGIEGISPEVRVRGASWDSAQGGYSFTSEGPGPITLVWTPVARPGNPSTSSPAVDTKPLAPDSVQVPQTPQILEFPAVGEFDFDDYIVTFPADSGLEPIYVMFKSPRDYPGVVKGNGAPVAGRWLEAAGAEAGAPIPAQVADQLRGKEFANFGRMREAFWKAVAGDSELNKHFTRANLARMLEGSAPKTNASGQVGSRGSFELHHIYPVAKGGAVYDLENLAVMTPKMHIGTHSKGSNQ